MEGHADQLTTEGWEKHSDFDKGVVINTVLEDGTLQDSLLKQNYSKLFAKLIVCCRRWLSIHNLPCKGLWGTKKDIDPHNTPIWDTMSDFGFWIYYNCEASNPHAGHQSHSAPAKLQGHRPHLLALLASGFCTNSWPCSIKARGYPRHQGGTMLEQPPETNAGTLVSIEMIRNEKINPLPCEENSNQREQVEAITMVV